MILQRRYVNYIREFRVCCRLIRGFENFLVLNSLIFTTRNVNMLLNLTSYYTLADVHEPLLSKNNNKL